MTYIDTLCQCVQPMNGKHPLRHIRDARDARHATYYYDRLTACSRCALCALITHWFALHAISSRLIFGIYTKFPLLVCRICVRSSICFRWQTLSRTHLIAQNMRLTTQIENRKWSVDRFRVGCNEATAGHNECHEMIMLSLWLHGTCAADCRSKWSMKLLMRKM